jgi:aryl-phospho-beta-D-glucosidase BglC (GH1 family)
MKIKYLPILLSILMLFSACGSSETPQGDGGLGQSLTRMTEAEAQDGTQVEADAEANENEFTVTAGVSADSETDDETAETDGENAAAPLAQTTTAATTKAVPKAVTMTVTKSNQWGDTGNETAQFDFLIKNTTDNNYDGWTASITLGKNASIEQNWGCVATVKDGVLTIAPVDYTMSLTNTAEVSFGIIVNKFGSFDEKSASVTPGKGTPAPTPAPAQTQAQNGSNGNNQNGGETTFHNPNNLPYVALDVPAPTTDDWLFTDGNKIVDKNGKEVWLTGINWFGYATGSNGFDGLWAADLNTSLQGIADHGFNLLRVPISVELLDQWKSGTYPNANFNQATNYYLVGMNSLEIFDYVVGQCRANGIKIMIDIHSAKTDSMGHMSPMWYNGDLTEADFIGALEWCAARYKNDDTIIAYDLKNEPHGKANESPRAKWDGSTDADNWKYIAEKSAKAVLAKNPNVLIMVEGIEIYPKNIKTNGDFSSTNANDYYSAWWGGNLRGVKDNPVNLGKYQNKLVYSPHDYGPTVYQQPWFEGNYTFDSIMEDYWLDSWFYIQKDNIAPLLIGEWGGFMREPNLKWMTLMRQLIKENRLNHTFWCYNANSGDTGGLIKDDFVTWDEEKYEFVKEVLWQKNGKFVGLDHKIPLGKNGITLTDA